MLNGSFLKFAKQMPGTQQLLSKCTTQSAYLIRDGRSTRVRTRLHDHPIQHITAQHPSVSGGAGKVTQPCRDSHADAIGQRLGGHVGMDIDGEVGRYARGERQWG